MRKMRLFGKVFAILLVMGLFSCLSLKINAGEVTTTTDNGQYNYTTVKQDVTQVSASTTYIKNTGYTTRNKTQYEQTNHIFVADYGKGEDIKVVSWAVQNDDGTGFVRKSIKAIGEDYERTHPGYIVLAGINADQYYMYFGTQLLVDSTDYYRPQSVYPLIAGGENWFTVSPYGYSQIGLGCITNVVGFPNDGRSKGIVYGQRTVTGLYIYVYDEKDQVVGKFKANDLNTLTELGQNETTVISSYRITDTTYQTMSKSSDNGFYIVEKADNCYVSNSVEYAFYKNDCAANAFFGKGTISKIDKTISLNKNQFAIETTNEELKNALKIGTYVKCQYDLDEGFSGIEEACGFHTVQRINGSDGSNVPNDYNSRPYPRSIVGCDDKGKIYMITNEGSNSYPTRGMWAQESNALMKQYGITDAFQMDGGGSVTCVVRDENGVLQYAMPSVESDYRYDLTGLFIVMKVTKANVDVNKVSQTTADINVDLSKTEEDYTNAYLKVIDNTTQKAQYVKVVDGKVTLNSLTPANKYSYILYLDLKNNEGQDIRKETYIKGAFETYPTYPVIEKVTIEQKNNKYNITIQYNDVNKLLVKMNVRINNKDYFANYSNGKATVSIDSTVNNILSMEIKMQCSPLGNMEIVYADDFVINASAMQYFDDVLDSIVDCINQFYKENKK